MTHMSKESCLPQVSKVHHESREISTFRQKHVKETFFNYILLKKYVYNFLTIRKMS